MDYSRWLSLTAFNAAKKVIVLPAPCMKDAIVVDDIFYGQCCSSII